MRSCLDEALRHHDRSRNISLENCGVEACLRTGESRWLPWIERIHEYCFKHFADPRHDEWFAYCDRQGNLTHMLKGNHYKGCFHVPPVLLLCSQAIENHLR